MGASEVGHMTHRKRGGLNERERERERDGVGVYPQGR